MSTQQTSLARSASSRFESLAIYADPKVIAILLLGFSSGLPILLVLTTLSTWLAEVGVSKGTIGLFGFVMAPYALKFIWAPLVDRLPLPGLTRLLGRRRSWMLVTQICLIGAIYGFGQTDPAHDLYWTAVFAILITVCSATQDIVIDAFRIDSLPESQLGAGAGVVVLGYRVGMWVATAGALLVADAYGWSMAYAAMAMMMLIGIVTTLLVREPEGSTTDLVDDDAKRQESLIRAAQPDELGRFKGVAGWLLIMVLVLLVLQPVSYLFGQMTPLHGVRDIGGVMVAAIRFGLVLWGMWIGWMLLARDPRAPGEAKDFVMASLLWLIAEVVAYGIPADGSEVWFAELYAWVALWLLWLVTNLVTGLFGHTIPLDSFEQPIWLLSMGLWLRFFFLISLYGYFYFSRRAVANFGLVPLERENKIHLWTRRSVVEPYYDFFKRYGIAVAVAILALISVFKASDAVLTVMANPFYIDLGFSKAQIAWVSKTFGLWMTLIGGLVGGITVHRFGMMRAMILAVIVMALSNLMFALLATLGSDGLAITAGALDAGRELTAIETQERADIGTGLLPLFYALIIIENISGGLGTAVFVAYLSSLCKKSYSAVQYAMLTSFMQMFAKFVVVPSSGFYQEALGWFGFFVTSTLFALPALLILWFLSYHVTPSAYEEPAD